MISLEDFLKKYDSLSKPLGEVDLKKEVKLMSPEQNPEAGSLVFISKKESIPLALKADVACIVIPESHQTLVPKDFPLDVVTSENPRLLMALSAREIFAKDKLLSQFEGFNSDISVAAIIHPSCKIAVGVKIGPNVVIGPNVTIEQGSVVGANVVIQSDSFIGKNSRIHEFAYIGQGSELGESCEVFPHAGVGTEGFGYASTNEGKHEPIPHQGKVVLEGFVHVGAGSQIDRGTFGETRIGAHTKIDNLCHIAHNCKIGKSSLLTAGFKVAGSTTIGDGFTCGGNTTVTGHITVADHVNVAGMSVVHKSITKAGSYYGYPLKPLKEGLKNNAAFGNLAQMKKDLDRVMKSLNLKES